jgi:hypothetical protein
MPATVPTLTDVVVESKPAAPPAPSVARVPAQREVRTPAAPRALRSRASPSQAVGAFALGALALGALAIGHLVIRRLMAGG